MIINSLYAKFRYLEICHEMVPALVFRGYTIVSIRFSPIFRFGSSRHRTSVIYPIYTITTKGYSKSYRKFSPCPVFTNMPDFKRITVD